MSHTSADPKVKPKESPIEAAKKKLSGSELLAASVLALAVVLLIVLIPAVKVALDDHGDYAHILVVFVGIIALVSGLGQSFFAYIRARDALNLLRQEEMLRRVDSRQA